MVAAEIQKLEAAARVAMGHFEAPHETSAMPRSVLSPAAYGLVALTFAAVLAIALL